MAVPMIIVSTSAAIVCFTLAGTSKKVPTREVTEVRRMLLSESRRQIFFGEQDCLSVVKIAGQIPTLRSSAKGRPEEKLQTVPRFLFEADFYFASESSDDLPIRDPNCSG